MRPVQLKAEQFASYLPQARAFVLAHLAILQQLPLAFVPSLLEEWIDYDTRFPAERAAIEKEAAMLEALAASQLASLFLAFAQIRISSTLEQFDWITHPAQFVEQLSAYLWSTNQLDAFRNAATAYGDHLQQGLVPAPLPVARLGVAIIGQGVASEGTPLFLKLREHGTYFTRVEPANGLSLLLSAAAARAEAHPVPYSHWYVDGGAAADHRASLTSISYQALAPVREALLKNIEQQANRAGMGPEALHSHLAALSPSDLGMRGDALLDHFQVKLLTEGSGSQIFSTTFAQWAAREVLRRAQALTLVVRFAPRQRQRPMNELLSSSEGTLELDSAGSLIDADMAAYYQWINQQRLPGWERSSFLVWFEEHRQALAVGPSLPCGSVSESPMDLAALLTLATS